MQSPTYSPSHTACAAPQMPAYYSPSYSPASYAALSDLKADSRLVGSHTKSNLFYLP